MGVLVGLSVILVVMLQQHLGVISIATKQSFLGQEAPRVGDLLGRIFNQADHYFVYATRSAAESNQQPVLTNGQAVRLYFKTAAQQTVWRMIAFEDGANGGQMRFYTPQPDGTITSWLISNQLVGASFRGDQGILSATLQGPNGEEITYCGGAR